jgi:glycosyltransferase involved in cell wall biosynthesis
MAVPSKKIILLTRLFPPQRSVGGRRIEQMARFFVDRGWEVSVVAAREASFGAHAHAAVQDSIPGARIVYTAAPRNRLPLPASMLERPPGGAGVFKTSLRAVRDLLIFPDNTNLWIPVAYRAARREMNGEGPVVVLTSSPPFSTHAAGLLLKRRFGPRVRWIADFRDPWFHPSHDYSGRFVDRLLVRLGNQVRQSADLMLVTTDAVLGTFDRYGDPDLRTAPIHCLPNGVRAGLFDGVEAETLAQSKTVFVHLGDLHYTHRNPEPLIAACGALVADGRLRPEQFELHFFGPRGSWQGRGVGDLAARHGCRASVLEHDAVEHRRALSIMRGADVLVLLADRQPWAIPAKTYEYLASGTRILALCEPDGATGQLLRDVGRAGVVSGLQPDSLKSMLMEYVAERELGGPRRPDLGAGGPRFEIGWHLEQLAGVFDAL